MISSISAFLASACGGSAEERCVVLILITSFRISYLVPYLTACPVPSRPGVTRDVTRDAWIAGTVLGVAQGVVTEFVHPLPALAEPLGLLAGLIAHVRRGDVLVNERKPVTALIGDQQTGRGQSHQGRDRIGDIRTAPGIAAPDDAVVATRPRTELQHGEVVPPRLVGQ